MSKNIVISGTITCEPDDLEMLAKEVKGHIALTRAEAGCISFDITQSAPGACEFVISERFTDRAAFDAHTTRTRASDWWTKTQHIPRDITITEE